MGVKERIAELAQRARERATDAAVDQAKRRATDAVHGASRLLGNLVFGKPDRGEAIPTVNEKEREQARAAWESAKARLAERERDGGEKKDE